MLVVVGVVVFPHFMLLFCCLIYCRCRFSQKWKAQIQITGKKSHLVSERIVASKGESMPHVLDVHETHRALAVSFYHLCFCWTPPSPLPTPLTYPPHKQASIITPVTPHTHTPP